VGHGTFQVDFTNAALVWNFTGEDVINGTQSATTPASHTFHAGQGLSFCPCQFAGFNLITPNGKQYILTVPNLGNLRILAISRNTMLGPFHVGDSRSINITTVPEPGTLGLLGTGLLALAIRFPLYVGRDKIDNFHREDCESYRNRPVEVWPKQNKLFDK
jgi:hypothetical protein